jgi:hypothetical protein
MIKDDEYYDRLDDELTQNTPEIALDRKGSFETVYASIVLLEYTDMTIAKVLAQRENMTVSDYLARTLRSQLAAS